MRCFVMVVCLISSASIGFAQTADQKRALEIMAGASVIPQYCKQLELDATAYGILMHLNGIDAADLDRTGRFAKFIYEKMIILDAEMKAAEPEHVCMTGLLAYGPEGALFADMLRWKGRN